MNLTEKEAKAKEKARQRVRVRDDSFLSEGVPIGTHGGVVEAHLLDTVAIGTGRLGTTGKQEEVWVVNVQFYPDGKPPGILIENIGKEQYDNSLVEA